MYAYVVKLIKAICSHSERTFEGHLLPGHIGPIMISHDESEALMLLAVIATFINALK